MGIFAKHTNRERSYAQEKRCSVYYNALLNPNSGAVDNPRFKGDLRDFTHVIECKCTSCDFIKVKKEDIRRIEMHARNNMKKYILNFEFQGETPDDVFYNMTLLPTNDFIEMYEVYKEHRKEEQSKLNNAETISVEDFIHDVVNKLDKSVKDSILWELQVQPKYKILKKYVK